MDSRDHDTGLILRHDVDFSLALAYEFSRLELEEKVLSTYHIRLTSDSYNPFGRSNLQLLRKMCLEGFDVGLHFDPRVYGDINETKAFIVFQEELHILEFFLGQAVYSFSFHEPKSTECFSYMVEGKVNAYSDEVFNKNCYVSDSTFNRYKNDMTVWIDKAKKQRIQFLSHPIQYFS